MVSVIVPLYNAERYIKKTIECILSQSYSDFEIMVCDDASTDNSRRIVETFSDKRISLMTNDNNMGISYTRNKLIEASNGEYIALWDDDDLCSLERLKKQVEAIEREDADVVIGDFIVIDAEDNPVSPINHSRRNPKYIRAYQLLNNCIPNGTGFIRKSFIDDNGIKYREGMCGAEDYRFWTECVVNGAKFYSVEDAILYYRLHGMNTSVLAMNNQEEERNNIIREIQKYALDSMGYKLSPKHYDIIFKLFKEEPIVIDTKLEIQILYESLCEIIRQSIAMGADNVKEIKDMCRIRFAEKIRKASVLWEISGE